MFNSLFRKSCASTVGWAKLISAVDTLQKAPKGWSGWQMAGNVRNFRHQPIKYPKRKKIYHPIYEYQETIEDTSEKDEAITKDVISKVNAQIASRSHGRLFAVIYVKGTQQKVTKDDIIVLEGSFAPQPGDTIRFEKVMLVGSTDFTLLGRPLLMPDLVQVTGTVVDQRLEATRYYFWCKPREQKKTSYFRRSHMTLVRINSIELTSLIDEKVEVEGIKGRVF